MCHSQNENAENAEKIKFYKTRGSESMYILQYGEITCCNSVTASEWDMIMK